MSTTASHLETLFQYIRFPSISTDKTHTPQVRACAEWLRERFTAMGLEAGVHETQGHPVVVARNAHRPDRRTVLIYGHYDVQPVDPLPLWESPPFEPRVDGDFIYARGAADNKGPFMAHFLGVQEMLRREGDLPVNIIFLVEGEEEIGSPSLEAFLTENRESLKPDIIAISDTGMFAAGMPSLTYGLRGILALEVRLKGAGVDLHSGSFGGIAVNPATLLARMVATLHDEDFRVAVPGFYDAVVPIQDWERDGWAKLPPAEERLRKAMKGGACYGEKGYNPYERAWARPTAEVNGLGGGYQGEGSKTVIPSEAFAKLTFRLVPDQTPHEIEAKVRAHLARVCPPEVTMEISDGHGGAPFMSDPMSPYGLAAQRALEKTWAAKPILMREGGSIPILNTFQRILQADVLLIGLALPGNGAHAPNENFTISNLEAGIQMNQNLLREIAALG